jgi:hypothetical protein
MQITIVLGLLILIQGCASFWDPQPVKKIFSQEKKAKRVTNPVLKAPKSPKRVKTSQAVWHLIFPEYLEFGLHHQETGKKELIRVETTLSDIELPAGHYNIESVIVGSERYDSLEGVDLFEFEIK